MVALINLERKIAGGNILWITILVLISYIVICITGGELIDWVYLGFEVMLPFYTAIAVSEWVRTKSDPLLEIIIVHARSLFLWVLGRFIYIFGITTTLSVIGMMALRAVTLEFSLSEVLFVYLSTAFFISSLGVLSSFFSRQAHAATAVCGTIWLFSLLVKSLVRFPAVAHVYLFIRFAEPDNPVWVVNKVVLLLLGIVMWLIIWYICYKRYLQL